MPTRAAIGRGEGDRVVRVEDPAMKLNISPVTSSQPPQTISAGADAVGARPRAAVNQSPATSSTSAAGSSQAIWPPNSASNSRVRPVSPHIAAGAGRHRRRRCRSRRR